MNVATVIPVRNRAKYIARALNSVASQTYQSAEIIVVDDASTDGTPDIVSGLAKQIPNIHLIKIQQNVGAGEARNVGIRQARSDLIAFLDFDDMWYPSKIEKQVREFEYDDQVIAVFSGSRVIYNDRSFSHVPIAGCYAGGPLLFQQIEYHFVGRDFEKSIDKGWGVRLTLPSCQDWDLFIRLAEIGKIRVVQEELIEFLNHDDERISRDKISVVTGHGIVRDRIYRRISDPILLRQVE